MFWNRSESATPSGWKQKATKRTLEIKALKKRNKELIKSRELWKLKAEKLATELDDKKKSLTRLT